MRNDGSIIKFKATALLLFALMLGVHALKFFHSHDISNHRFAETNTNENIITGTGEKSFHCSICDYYFTGYINSGLASLAVFSIDHKSSFTHFSADILVFKLFALPGRGPPSLLV